MGKQLTRQDIFEIVNKAVDNSKQELLGVINKTNQDTLGVINNSSQSLLEIIKQTNQNTLKVIHSSNQNLLGIIKKTNQDTLEFFESSNQDLLEVINNSFSEMERKMNNFVTKDELNDRFTKFETRMVTKDYLDKKLSELRGDLIESDRKIDKKIVATLDLLITKKFVTKEEKTKVLA